MASTPVYAKFIYNGRINTVALIDGLSVEELTGLLKTVFTISGSIVGIMAEVSPTTSSVVAVTRQPSSQIDPTFHNTT